MDILLDTHILLWHLADDPRLPKSYTKLLNDPRNRKFLSIVSLWEVAIKVSVGKLKLLQPLDELVPTGISILPLQLSHLSQVQTLPYHHRDPFDRMLIAQALTENLALLSVDSQFAAYGVTLL
jgi:PIN domain nuclease of toxin-antitoxin system